MSLLFLPLAAGGSGIFLGFAIAMFVIAAFGLYTRKGSGIEQRPGKKGPSDIAGDQGEGGTFGGDGTR
jgi:hypothetical protein